MFALFFWGVNSQQTQQCSSNCSKWLWFVLGEHKRMVRNLLCAQEPLSAYESIFLGLHDDCRAPFPTVARWHLSSRSFSPLSYWIWIAPCSICISGWIADWRVSVPCRKKREIRKSIRKTFVADATKGANHINTEFFSTPVQYLHEYQLHGGAEMCASKGTKNGQKNRMASIQNLSRRLMAFRMEKRRLKEQTRNEGL